MIHMVSRNVIGWEDIFELKRTGEKTRVDFKTTPFMKDNNEIAAQLTSFANRYGGTILIGVKDEEDLQGWDAVEGATIDRDKCLLHISNIAMSKCSPPVDFSSDFLTSDKGDVLVLNVERRRSEPHAIVERAGHEIKKRIYYLRTESGKRLASDRVLNYMFKELEDPYFEHNFAIGMQYFKDDLSLSGPMIDMDWGGKWRIISFMAQLKKEDIEFLKGKEVTGIRPLFVELLPYAMIGFLSHYFSSSWVVDIEKVGNSTTISPCTTADKKEITLENIPTPPRNSVLSKLSPDIKSVFRNQFFRLVLPPETEVKMTLRPTTPHRSMLKLVCHNSFEFVFSFREGSWMAGPGRLSPLYGILDKFKEEIELAEAISSFFIRANISFKFAFPDIDDPLFETVYQWGRLIKDLVREYWDWEMIVGRLPERKLFLIENYVKRILKILEKQNRNKSAS